MCSRHKLVHEKQLEAQHRCEINKIRNVALRMEVADVNGPIDVALVDLAIEKISPVDFLKLFDALDRVLTGEEHVELRLIAQPFVKAFDDAVDLRTDQTTAFFDKDEVLGRNVETVK